VKLLLLHSKTSSNFVVHPLLISGLLVFSHLNNNTISGEIPVELSKLPKLVHMWVLFVLFSHLDTIFSLYIVD